MTAAVILGRHSSWEPDAVDARHCHKAHALAPGHGIQLELCTSGADCGCGCFLPQPLKLLLLGCTGVLQGHYLALQAADLHAEKAVVAWLCLCARQQAAEAGSAAMAGLQQLACMSMLQACNLAGRTQGETGTHGATMP